MHSERPPDDIHELGSHQEIIQLWVNTPARHKMDQPEYFPLQENEIPRFVTDNGLATVNVISGELLGVKGPVPAKTDVNAATIYLKKDAKIDIPLPPDHNSFLYILNGKINLANYGLTEPLHAALFENDGEGIGIEALEDTRILLMSGAPLNEKVVSHGPFVMNNETQILEAMRDYQKGKMGILIED